MKSGKVPGTFYRSWWAEQDSEQDEDTHFQSAEMKDAPPAFGDRELEFLAWKNGFFCRTCDKSIPSARTLYKHFLKTKAHSERLTRVSAEEWATWLARADYYADCEGSPDCRNFERAWQHHFNPAALPRNETARLAVPQRASAASAVYFPHPCETAPPSPSPTPPRNAIHSAIPPALPRGVPQSETPPHAVPPRAPPPHAVFPRADSSAPAAKNQVSDTLAEVAFAEMRVKPRFLNFTDADWLKQKRHNLEMGRSDVNLDGFKARLKLEGCEADQQRNLVQGVDYFFFMFEWEGKPDLLTLVKSLTVSDSVRALLASDWMDKKYSHALKISEGMSRFLVYMEVEAHRARKAGKFKGEDVAGDIRNLAIELFNPKLKAVRRGKEYRRIVKGMNDADAIENLPEPAVIKGKVKDAMIWLEVLFRAPAFRVPRYVTCNPRVEFQSERAISD